MSGREAICAWNHRILLFYLVLFSRRSTRDWNQWNPQLFVTCSFHIQSKKDVLWTRKKNIYILGNPFIQSLGENPRVQKVSVSRRVEGMEIQWVRCSWWESGESGDCIQKAETQTELHSKCCLALQALWFPDNPLFPYFLLSVFQTQELS